MTTLISSLPFSVIATSAFIGSLGEMLGKIIGPATNTKEDDEHSIENYAMAFFRTLQNGAAASVILKGSQLLYPSFTPVAMALGAGMVLVPVVNQFIRASSTSTIVKSVSSTVDFVTDVTSKAINVLLPTALLSNFYFNAQIINSIGVAMLIPLTAVAVLSAAGLAGELVCDWLEAKAKQESIDEPKYARTARVVSKLFQMMTAAALLSAAAMMRWDALSRPLLAGALGGVAVLFASAVPFVEQYLKYRIVSTPKEEDVDNTIPEKVGIAASILLNLASKVVNCMAVYRLFHLSNTIFLPLVASALLSANLIIYTKKAYAKLV